MWRRLDMTGGREYDKWRTKDDWAEAREERAVRQGACPHCLRDLPNCDCTKAEDGTADPVK